MDRQPRLTREESRQQTRAKMIEAAERVFILRGFEAAAVEEIAAEAGFTRGAFYSNFASKDDLLLQLLEKRYHEERERLERLVRDNPEPARRYAAVRDWYAEKCERSTWTILKCELRLRALHNPALRKNLAQFHNSELEAYARQVESYFADAGLVNPVGDRAVALALMEAAQGLSFLLSAEPGRDAERLAGEGGRLAFESLLGRPQDRAVRVASESKRATKSRRSKA